MEVIQFRKMLTEVSKGMRDEELTAMKFICRDFIPKRRQQEIVTALGLWEALEERELLGVNNTRFLRELLETSGEGRTDLLRIVAHYDGRLGGGVGGGDGGVMGGVGPVGTIHATTRPIQESNHFGGAVLEKEIHFVADNVGRDWRMLGRTLGVPEPEIERIEDAHSRDLKEQCRQCLFVWRKTQPAGAVNREQLITALRKISQNYVADELEEM